MPYHEITIGAIVAISLFIITILVKKKDKSCEAYSNHIKNLVNGIYSNTAMEGHFKVEGGQESHTDGFIGEGLNDISDFSITIRSSPLKKDIVEHLKSYQGITKIPLYDDYKNSILAQKQFERLSKEEDSPLEVDLVNEKTLGERKIIEIRKRYKLRTKFAEEFNTLRQKINSDSNPNFGNCVNGCPSTFKTKFRKLKFCKSKQDDSLWNDETW